MPFASKEHDSHLPLSLLIALLISLLFIHAPIIYFMAHHDFFSNRANHPVKKENVVMVDLKDLNMPNRIADISKPKTEKKPKQASAFSKYDSSVQEETTALSSVTKQSQPMQQQSLPQQSSLTQNTENTKKDLSLQEELQLIQSQQKYEEQKKYASLYNKQTNPSPMFKNQSIPGSGFQDDYLPYYKVGNRTYLNTLANPHIGYFVELKRKFRLSFNPAMVIQSNYDKLPKGEIAVIWGVSVDQAGNLKDLVLIRSSELPGYDYEARRTILSSAPFTHPPKELLEQDGLLNMAWTFIVHL